ncbi:MAG TPA: hypothetical protein VL053_14010 [Arachidicoccus sp.]|nr:hypothetical protein [Arachidicoccus sp.]
MKKLLYTTFAFSVLLAACGRRTVPSKSSDNGKLHPKIAPDRVDKKQYVKKATIIDSTQTGFNNGQVGNKTITDSYGSAADSAAAVAKADSLTSAASILMEPVVVIDSRGKLMIDTLNLPPTVSHNLDSLNQSIRSFTPNEAKNLAYRFKQIPPRVLFVPDNLAKKGRKGYYYKYNNKFWYWKKADGYFYLDENYYK